MMLQTPSLPILTASHRFECCNATSVVCSLRFVPPSCRGCACSCLSSPRRAELMQTHRVHALTLAFFTTTSSESEPCLKRNARTKKKKRGKNQKKDKKSENLKNTFCFFNAKTTTKKKKKKTSKKEKKQNKQKKKQKKKFQKSKNVSSKMKNSKNSKNDLKGRTPPFRMEPRRPRS